MSSARAFIANPDLVARIRHRAPLAKPDCTRLCAAAAQRAARFMEIADAFHLPLVFLIDNPGVLSGTAAEIRACAQVVRLRELADGDQPVRQPDHQPCLPHVWPGRDARRGGCRCGQAKPSGTRPDTEVEQAGRAYAIAAKLGFDDVIDPRELRNALLDGLHSANMQGGLFEPK